MLEDYENLNESQKMLVSHFVTNVSSSVFCLRNLPEVIKGALFSRYSRSTLGLRSLLLKEFILNEETAFASIAGQNKPAKEEQLVAIKRAQNFYDRILDGYGDDSIGELGGAHLAIENVSMLGAKVIEDARIGGSFLEKSTRYVYFDQKIKGEYLFYREPVLMTSAYRDRYVDMCNALFDTYSALIPPVTELMEKKFPKAEGVSKVAYTAALRAKVLDCLRGLLPVSTFTNMGAYGNGRFFEGLLQKLNACSLAEMQDIGKEGFNQLSQTIPSFIRRAEGSHKYCQSFVEFIDSTQREMKALAQQTKIGADLEPGVKLVNYDPDSLAKLAAALLFSSSGCSLEKLQNHCRELPKEELVRILESASAFRENRRHKSPRSLECGNLTFEIVADFGVYRDLQRHRILTQERQGITCNLGYYVPKEIQDTDLEERYCSILDKAKEVYDTIATQLPEEAQYVVPMAYNMHWYFHLNFRALQWVCELRSGAAGHPSYRYIAQAMAKETLKIFPEMEGCLKFVDYEGYDIGRLDQEVRIVKKARN